MRHIAKNLGLIGCGNMGTAVLSGLIRNGISKRNRIFVYDAVRSKRRSTSKVFGVRMAEGNGDLAERVSVILLAVKPQDLRAVGAELRDKLRANQTVVSILAGTPIKKLRRALGNRVSLVRVMPNLGAQVGEAVTAVTASSPSALRLAEAIFSGCGRVIRLPEKYFDLVTAVSGSGPAYFFLMMELLSRVAEQGGIPKRSARLLAVQTAFGAGKLALVSTDLPKTLREKVTSKGGTTEAAFRFLTKKKFGIIFTQGVRRAVLRARELSRNS